MQPSTIGTDRGHNLVILPTSHEDVLSLKDKLSTFSNRQWQVQDFGAFGTFEFGFLLIEIDSPQGYRNFKKDICSLTQQGLKYAYPEHALSGYPPNQRCTPDRSGQLGTTRQVRVSPDLPTPQEQTDEKT